MGKLIAGPAGQLEVLVELPEYDAGRSIGVVCHPHPLFQGTMQNKIVSTLVKVMHVREMPTLRFQFRGVGGSEGVFDQGKGEVEDVLAAIRYLQEQFPNRTLWLAGFSFGGAMAIEASLRVQTEQLILVAPSLRCRISTELPTCPMLIAQGDADEIIDAATVFEFAHRSGATLIRFPTVGHFFHGQLIALKEALVSAL